MKECYNIYRAIAQSKGDIKMKETIMEEAIRSILQLINNGGADSVTLKKIDGRIDAVHYYGLATYEHSSSLEALERCNDAFHQLNGEIDGIGFYAPAEIRFRIDRIAFWREVDQWLEKIGAMQGGELNENIDDGHCEEIGKTIGELAKSLRWKNLIGRD